MLTYPVPENSIVTQTFAEHVWRAKVNGWQNYNGGIDWAVSTNTPIRAAMSGKALEPRTDATGYGTHVRLQHAGGYMTIYGHLARFIVKQGEPVDAGQIIGYSDNTGNSTGPHLHFELRLNNVAIDPQPLLSGGEPTEELPETPVEATTIGTPAVRLTPSLKGMVIGRCVLGQEFTVQRFVKSEGIVWAERLVPVYSAVIDVDGERYMSFREETT